MSNSIVSVTFNGLRFAYTLPLFQYDYGQTLLVTDLDLPTAYEVHFSNTDDVGTSTTVIGTAEGADIPNALLETGSTIYAWIYLHDDSTDGETEYKVTVPVNRRPNMSDVDPELIRQAIVVLNAAVAQTGADVTAAGSSAQAAAGSAETAEAAAASAESSAMAAAESEQEATASAAAAAGSASDADTFAAAAARSAQESAASAADADASAERAEQAAATVGWMAIGIDHNGHLIYERTRNAQIDLSIDSNGHLTMEAAT